MADVQIAIIDPEDTQLALAAPAEAVVNVAVPGIQGPIGTTGSVTIAQAGTAATPGIRFESDTNTGIYSPGADQVAVSTGGTGRLFVDSSGKVGIGVGSPGATFDLAAGAGASVTAVLIRSVAANANGFQIVTDSTTDNVYLNNFYNAALRFGTNNTERLRIDSSGRVGIGTTSPSQLLTLNGNLFVGSSFNGQAIGDASAERIRIGYKDGAPDTGLVPAQIITDASILSIAARDTAASAIRFHTGTGVAESLRIDSSGRVGIGTSSPSSKLHVRDAHTLGNASQIVLIENTTVGEPASLAFLAVADNSGAGNQGAIYFDAGTDGATADNKLQFTAAHQSSITPQMTLNGSGQLGIGTSSPGVNLDVASTTPTVRVNATGGGTPSLSLFSSGVYDWLVQGGTALKIVQDTTERLRIDSSGRVGIGTSTPRGLLSIANNAAGTGVVDSSLHFGYSLADYYGFRVVNSNEPAAQAAGLLKFQRGTVSNWIDSVVINNSGNVGIGTSSPAGRLHVSGGDCLFGSGSLIRLLSGGEVIDFSNGAQDTYVNGRISGLSLKFYTNNGSGIDIDSSGRVGIGTSSPSGSLDITGTAPPLLFQSTSALSNYITHKHHSSGDIAYIGAGGGAATTAGTASDYAIRANLGALIFATNGNNERLRIDSSGRLLVGTSTARSNFYNTSFANSLQIEGVDSSTTTLSLTSNNSSTVGQEGTLVFAKSNGGSSGSNVLVSTGTPLGRLSFQGSDGSEFVEAASIQGFVDGTPGANDMPGRLVFSTTADGAATPTERLRITSAGVLQIADAGDITVGTTTGTKIGTATTQKIGFYNATPVVQPTAVADATDAASVITQLNALLTRMRNLGLIAT